MRRIKLSWRFLAPLLVVALVVAACGGGDDATSTARPAPTAAPAPTATPAPPPTVAVPQVIRHLAFSGPPNDPHFTVAWMGTLRTVYDNLLLLDEVGLPQPSLAKSWESVDANTWRFKIEEGVKFHNGEDLTAEDVAFSMNRIVTEKLAGLRHFGTVSEAIAVDDVTVDLKTPKADVLIPSKLQNLRILPKDYFESVGVEDFLAKPVGSGPYRFTEFEFRVKWTAELTGQPHAFRTPILQRIEANIIREPATMEAALRSGNADISHTQIEPANLTALENDGFVVVAPNARSLAHLLAIGKHTREGGPLADKRVRQALIYAVDAESIATNIWRGYAVAVSSPTLSTSIGYDPSAPIPFNVDKANQLLDDAGYPRGSDGIRFSLTYRFNRAGAAEDTAFAFQEMWKAVGIDVDTAQLDRAAFVDHLFRRDGKEWFDIMGQVGIDGYLNSVYYLTQMTRDATGGTIEYQNPAFYAKLDQILAEFDFDKQAVLIREAMKIVSVDGDPPYFYAITIPEPYVMTDKVADFELAGGLADIQWENIRLTA